MLFKNSLKKEAMETSLKKKAQILQILIYYKIMKMYIINMDSFLKLLIKLQKKLAKNSQIALKKVYRNLKMPSLIIL